MPMEYGDAINSILLIIILIILLAGIVELRDHIKALNTRNEASKKPDTCKCTRTKVKHKGTRSKSQGAPKRARPKPTISGDKL